MYKGSKHTKKAKIKMREAKIGKYRGVNSPHWKEKIKKICLICKKEFFVIPFKKNKVKYCSKQCKTKSQKGKPAWNKNKKLHYTVWNKNKKLPQFSMEKSFSWKGGKTKSSAGYIYIYIPAHPYSRNGYMAEHRLVMENYLRKNKPNHLALIKIKGKKYLRPKWRVHHKGIKYSMNSIKNKQDNRIKNFKLFPNEKEHQKFHSSLQLPKMVWKKGNIPWNKKK